MENKGYFLTLWLYIWTSYIKNSVTYKILHNIYAFISEKWQQSVITNLFRRVFLSDNAAESSLWGKILFSPFRLIDTIRRKHGERLSGMKDASVTIRFCKYLLHNFLAFNLRFIGVFAVCGAAVDLIISLVYGKGIILDLAAIVIGAVFCFLDVNVTAFFKEALIVRFVEGCLGTKLDFDFYYITKCDGVRRLYCAGAFGAACGVICGIFSPLYAAAFIIGILFVFTVFYKTEFGVFCTLFLAPIIPTMAVVGLSLLCFISLIVRAVMSKKFEWRFDGVGLLILSLVLIYLLASVTSFARAKSLQIWAVYFAFMMFYFVIINTVKTKKQFFNLLTVFALSGFCVCLYGILQYVFGWNINQAWIDEEMFEDIKMRIYSTLENPNVLGEYILLVLPVTISLMWTRKGALAKIVYAALSVVMFGALILTFSRGCWVGIMFSAAVFITFAAGKLWGLALIALPVIPMVLPKSIINRFTSIGNMKDSSTSYRVYIWMGTLLMLKDFWLSGIGPGTEAFTQVYPFYSYNAIVAPHSHNMFLQIIVESGAAGIFTFLLMIFILMKNMVVGYTKGGKGAPLSTALVGIAAGLIGFLVQGMFDNCFYNYRVFMIFWCMAALGMCAVGIAKKEAEIQNV